MRLLETIVLANQASAEPRHMAAIAPADYHDALPLVLLTCLDARLNVYIPQALGLSEDQIVWLRNAGNIVTGVLSSTMRSLALACAIKKGREIAVIGHTDCLVGKTTALSLLEGFQTLGIERHQLPENLLDFFGMFASERQNVMRAVELIRSSPIIGQRIPVHGLILHTHSGRLEWVINGYQALDTPRVTATTSPAPASVETVLYGPAEVSSDVPVPEPSASVRADVPALSNTPIGSASTAAQWMSDVSRLVSSTFTSKSPLVEAVKTAVDWTAKLDRSAQFKVIGSDQKVYGPIGGIKLLKWIAEGRVTAQTPAQIEGSEEWKPLASWAEESILKRVPIPPRLPKSKPK